VAGGRFNHYWFDLNRDWLPAVHVESQNRLAWFHKWKPNILTDHHEQGSNATFFFQPGVASRVNPLTPEKNQELTGKLAKFHAAFWIASVLFILLKKIMMIFIMVKDQPILMCKAASEFYLSKQVQEVIYNKHQMGY
jgi:hypothetical protein